MKELRLNESWSPSSPKICDSHTLCIVGFVAFLFSGWSGLIWATKPAPRRQWHLKVSALQLPPGYCFFCFGVSAGTSCCFATFLHIRGKIMRNLWWPQAFFGFHHKVFSHNYAAYRNTTAYLMFFIQIKNWEPGLANQRDNLVAKV